MFYATIHFLMNSQQPIEEQIFFDGSSYFDALLRDISQAKQSIDLETYIFVADSLGEKIAAALMAAVQRKVEVRLVVDSAGTPDWGGSLSEKLEQAGVKNRVFHPFPWRLYQWSYSKIHLPGLLKAVYLLLKMNSRNHRKTCVIDKNIVYVGSFNISQCHLSKKQHGEGWRDTGVRLSEVDSTVLQQAFMQVWQSLPIPERIKTSFRRVRNNPLIRLNNTWHRRRALYKNLLRRIGKCQQRIWITNAYFVPDNFLLRKLKKAAKKGVNVCILLPRESDVLFIPWASTTFYAQLLKAGVRIFEYLPSMLHAKTLILDDWMTVGSSNLNYRSLLHDLEVDINITQNESKKILVEQFQIDIKNAKAISLTDWQRRPLYQRFFGYLLLYIKYWLSLIHI